MVTCPSPGTLFGIGVGPGDPDLLTVRAAQILAGIGHVFAPRASDSKAGAALEIARTHISPGTSVHDLVFPMATDPDELEARWLKLAAQVAVPLNNGEDAAYITLGDTLLYSTYIYLIRALRKMNPDIPIVTIPGVTAFSACAAISEFTVGEGKAPVTIIPSSDDPEPIKEALKGDGAVVIMKVGKRLQSVIELLEREGRLNDATFVSRAGFDNQRIERDPAVLLQESPEAGYLSTILVRGKGR